MAGGTAEIPADSRTLPRSLARRQEKGAKMKRMIVAAVAFAFCGVVPVALQAEPAKPPKTEVAVDKEKEKEQPRTVAKAPSPARKVPAAGAKRWIDWQTGSVESRYRWIENTAGVESSDSMQHKQAFKAGFKFDEQGRYTIQAFAGTGSSFVGSWDNLGPGIGEPAWTFNLRQLYVQAQPVKGVEGSWGGMQVLRGEHTEITSFDNDNYVMAGRASVKRPAQLYFDEVSVTAGYFGDTNTPNVIKRFDRWDEHNYTQVLVGKKLGKIVAFSFDWTEIQDISTLRQAVKITTKQWFPIDAFRYENYQRVNGLREDWGYTVSAEKALTSKLTIQGGFADIDRFNGQLSGDRYFIGKRLFVEPKYQLLPELTLSAFYTEAVGNAFAVTNEHRFDFVVQYNVLKALQRYGAW